MEKFNALIEKKIAPVANKLSRQKYLQALQNTFLALIPFMTIGSFCLVIISPPMDYTAMSAGILKSFFQGWTVIAKYLGSSLGFIYLITMTVMSLYVAVILGYQLAKHYKMNPVMPMLITTMSFLIAATMNPDRQIIVTYLDGSGLFTAILVSICSFELYRFLVKKKVGYINLTGGGVPPALADSIGNLVPVLIVLITVAAVSNAVLAATGAGFPALMTTLMTPFVKMVDNIWGIVILAIIVMTFWWFGIHDTVITGPLTPFLLNNYTSNVTAFAAGTAAVSLPYIVTEPFWWTFMAIGGSGATLGLAFLAATSKSKQIKTIGRLCLIPSLFNINEPLIFGLPLMYNPTMMIPFVLVMPLNAVITYLAMDFGLVARTFADASWNMISPIGALINTMDIKAVLLVFILILLDLVIYFPFFKVYEKQKLKEEVEV
ncbi:PTS sugar transporter subunit IIC [Anaerostipes sp.]|uniref:PTS sugar transporter subunit IIC n=1 Tax=Anaerostipes sp. TaxID=1872530 RepID=UPI0025BE9EB1|nr:PTS transporter subunit EIIC [Anaerostipes sp.]MBS7009446.1 PTS sugar transporter subunit IIC [Anaerostipes sp.]